MLCQYHYIVEITFAQRKKTLTMKFTYFVHSTTCDNEAGLATGWTDSPLSAKGRVQAKELQLLVSQNFDVVFCSDLSRAIETASTAFGSKSLIKQDWRLREINYGELSQKSSKEVKKDLMKHVNHPFPNGESYSDVANRMREFVQYLKQTYCENSIAVVAHQAPQLALDVILKAKTWAQAFQDDWRNTHAWQPGWIYEVGDNI